MKKQFYAILLLIVVTAVATIAIYPSLPHLVPSHWNATGEINGYVTKSTHVGMFVFLLVALPVLLLGIPKLDPKYKAIQKFEDTFQWFVVDFEIFFMALYGYTLAIASGYNFPIMWVLIPAMSLLFFSIGNMLQITEQNYTIGIRTPWTLSDPEIWKKTHELGSKTFKYGSILALVTVFLGKAAFPFFITIILLEALIPVGYSYWLFREKSN